MEADGVDRLAIGGVFWLQDQVEWLRGEHGVAEVHEDHHDEDLINRVEHNLSPEFGIHDKIFPADSWASLILPVRLSSERDGTKDIHDQVAPEHLDDVKGWVSHGGATQDCDEAEDHIDGELELDEFSNIVIESSSPLDSPVDRAEIVIHDDEVRAVLGDVAAATHAETNIGLPEGLSIGDAIASHSDHAAPSLDTFNHDELLLRGCPRDDLQSPFQFIKLREVVENNLKLALCWVPCLGVALEMLTKLLSVHDAAILH